MSEDDQVSVPPYMKQLREILLGRGELVSEKFHDSLVCPPGLAGKICRYCERIGQDEFFIYEHFEPEHTRQEIEDALNQLVRDNQITKEPCKFTNRSSYRWWNFQVDDHGRVLY